MVTTLPSKPKGKPRGRPFQKGQSGNPGGRPKSERAYLVEKYGEDGRALHEALDALLMDPAVTANVKAQILEWKLERHSGKAPQTLDLNANVSTVKTVVHEHRPA